MIKQDIIQLCLFIQVGGFNYVLSTMFPLQNMITSHTTTTSKLKDVAKNASELAKAKAAPIYASLHPNKS